MEFITRYTKLWWGKLLVLLGASVLSGGLEITDQALRFAYAEGDVWHVHAMRLEPGVLEKGRIKDKKLFIENLFALKADIVGADGRDKKIGATVAIGEEAVYNQIFILPELKGLALESAIRLNMQMASPMDIGQVYAGWQIAARNEESSHIEVLAAFADRSMVDEIVSALFESRFVPIAVESKALALARLLRERGTGVDLGASYLLVNVDDAGLEFLIIRKGQLYFEYANPWRDLVDEKGAIAFDKFKNSLAIGLRQVMNFYLQHWNDPIAGVIVSGTTFLDEVGVIVRETLALPTLPLVVAGSSQTLSSEWFPVMGAALRGSGVRRKKEDGITLLGEGAQAIVFRDRITHFLEFWSWFVPVALASLLIVFGVAYFFLAGVQASIAPYQSSESQLAPVISAALEKLAPQVADFNQSVAFIQSIQAGESPKYTIVQSVAAVASASAVTVTKLIFQGSSQPISLDGNAQSQDQIVAFKTALATAGFTNINLPLMNLQSNGGAYAFSMTFQPPAPTSTPASMP
jgi:hypothetical protein